VRGLNSAFEQQHYQSYFYLAEEEVMKDAWLLQIIKKLQEKEMTVMGMKQLKKHHYNLHAPRVTLRAGTGIDWFDLQVKVSFGDQELKLNDFRQAILNKQTFVKLGDGSIGILPEEWIQKYEGLFAASTVKKEGLQINRFQATLIDNLYDEIDNNEALYELQAKLKRLYQFEGLKKYPAPVEIKAELRPYQQTGFEWLCFLDDYGWGGCLADDMGLGKTLQMLTFLQHKINTTESFTALVVVPTSLMFNWENEINKFTPNIKLLMHTGLLRKREVEHFSDFQIILTTYGLLRRDIEMMQDYVFDYVILDESQAIKNPMAQISKCVKLLKAKNRLVMSGTPVENSTFDLYSQFDFLNPGMLGTLETFKYNFANLIDNETDEAATLKLKKQLFPFILSRKKNEVAKELPEKTETVLYCEMDENQKVVYDDYRKRIRQELTTAIEENGVAKSSLMILQAFTKLRQICNSPMLLKDESDNYSEVEGVKLRIIMENVEALIQENHKVLLFSFFTSMLKLVEDRLAEKNIPFVKITGETTNRKEKVEIFQEDENIKVFLISLKAGGTGLNLTAADYVYLIDPWWNPAVEQQAIDRTHRIGQDKHIFAYKLICRGTIEEKILQLQQKKKNLVNDLIQLEKGGLKNLSKEDVLEILGG
jgi:non-specific serine/threonine protein kinase